MRWIMTEHREPRNLPRRNRANTEWGEHNKRDRRNLKTTINARWFILWCTKKKSWLRYIRRCSIYISMALEIKKKNKTELPFQAAFVITTLFARSTFFVFFFNRKISSPTAFLICLIKHLNINSTITNWQLSGIHNFFVDFFLQQNFVGKKFLILLINIVNYFALVGRTLSSSIKRKLNCELK